MIKPASDTNKASPTDTQEVSLNERLAFERLLGDLSAELADIPAHRVIAAIEEALACLVEFLDFDRCTFAELSSDTDEFDILCSFARPGFEPTARGTAPRLPWYLGELRAGRIVRLGSIPSDVPKEARAEIEYCRQSGLVSNLGVPLRVGGRVIGAIAFTAFRHTRAWPDELVVRLKIVG